MLTYLTLGILCGRLTIKRSLNWARSNLKWLKRFMKLENGIASEPTISRMLNGIDQELFCYAFIEWIGEIISTNMVNNYLKECGVKTVLLSALDYMRTDKNAEPDSAYIKDKLTKLLEQNQGQQGSDSYYQFPFGGFFW